MSGPPPRSTLLPYPTLFRSCVSITPRNRALISDTATNRAASSADGNASSSGGRDNSGTRHIDRQPDPRASIPGGASRRRPTRSEEHTSELQSHLNLVCRLLL